MTKRFFVVFCKQITFEPKLYKRMAYVEKKLTQKPELFFSPFQQETQAEDFYHAKLAEYKNNKHIMFMNLINQPPKIIKEVQKQPEKVEISNTQNSLKQIKIDSKEFSEKQAIIKTIISKNSKLIDYHPSKINSKIDPNEIYTGHFDGCSKNNPGQSGIGFFICKQFSHQSLLERAEYTGYKTSNEAQFLSLIYLMMDAYCNNIKKIVIYGDSKLVLNFMNGVNKAQKQALIQLYLVAIQISQRFQEITFNHIRRQYNAKADQLSNDGYKKKSQKASFFSTMMKQKNKEPEKEEEEKKEQLL